LNVLLRDGRNKAQQEIAALINKIRVLTKELSGALPSFQLQKMLGPAAIAIGMSFVTHADAQSFKPPVLNPFGLILTNSEVALPSFGDLDGDGDIDILIGEYNSMANAKWRFQKNTGNPLAPQFVAPQINPFGLTAQEVAFPHLVDLDGDSDLDIVSVENYGLSFFKNSGSATAPQFDAPVLNPFGITFQEGTSFPAFADIDDDGDVDIMAFGEYGALFFENTGSVTNPQFALPVTNPFGLTPSVYTYFPDFADLDGDGDKDLLVGELYGTMQYFKNIGTVSSPQFAAPVENPFGLVTTNYYAVPTFADLDNDGDQDLLVGEYYGNMQYFENTGVSGTHTQLSNIQLDLFPNPAQDVLAVSSDTKFERIEAYDVLGRLQAQYDGAVVAIDVSSWSSGTYLFKFLDGKGGYATKKVQKE